MAEPKLQLEKTPTDPLEDRVVTLRDGTRGYITRPSGMSDKKWNEELASIGATEYRTWGQWAEQNIVPQTPTEWAIFLASSGAPIGKILSKIAPKAAPVLGKFAQYGLSRIAGMAGAGAAGGGVEALREESDVLSGVEHGAVQGLLTGMTGVGSEKLLNLGSRMVMGRFVRASDAKSLNGFMQDVLPELQKAGGNPADTFAAIAAGDLKGIAGARLRNGLDAAASLSKAKAVHSPELGQFLEDFSSPAFPRPANDIFTPEYALDAFSLIGQRGFKEGTKLGSQSALAAQHLRGMVQNQIQEQIGPEAAAAWQKGQGEHAMAMELYRLFKEKPGDIFPKGPEGGINFLALQKRLTEKYAANPEAQKKLGSTYQDLLETVFRGGERVYDVPGNIGGLGAAAVGAGVGAGAAYAYGKDAKEVAGAAALGAGAGAFGHARFHPGGASMGTPVIPSYAGKPFTPGSALDPAIATIVNDLVRSGMIPTQFSEQVAP